MSVIEVFADICCPFTHLGLRRFVQRRAEVGRTDVLLWVRAWPLEIVNGAPLDPAFIADEVRDLQALRDPRAFAAFDPATFPITTLPALALAAAAHRDADDVGEMVSLHLRSLLFEQGMDVSSGQILDEVAAEFDIEATDGDGASVLADHAEGVRRGVIGSPHFFTPAGDYFCPALDIHRSADGHLQVAFDSERFDRFIAACLT